MGERRYLSVELNKNIDAMAVYDDGLLVAILPEQINVSARTITMQAARYSFERWK